MNKLNYPEDIIDKIHCADCLDFMRRMPDECVDLVVTDPPYGIKRDKGFGGFGGFGKKIARRRYEENDWDNIRPSAECFFEILRISKAAIVCGGNFFADMLPQGKHWIFCDKLNTMPTFGDGELIWTNIKRMSVKKFTHEWNGLLGKEQERYHPTQKPVALMIYLLQNYSKAGDIICDPYLGSGTTALAALKLNRHYIGIDISPEYCEIARERIRIENSQLKLDLTAKGGVE